jgi:hypothetical protein
MPLTPEESRKRKDRKYRQRMAERSAEQRAKKAAERESRLEKSNEPKPSCWNLPLSLLRPWESR